MELIRTVLVLLVAPFALLADSQQSDFTSYSVIHSQRRKVPRYCANSYAVINCIGNCVEPPFWTNSSRLDYKYYVDALKLEMDLAATKKSSKNNTLFPAQEEGASIPCPNKCESDPHYWSCVEECDRKDFTSRWVEQCFTRSKPGGSGICNNENFYKKKNDECFACLEQATRKQLWKACEILYLPGSVSTNENICEKMSTCENTPAATGSPTINSTSDNSTTKLSETIHSCFELAKANKAVKVLITRICVNQKIMHAQRECCSSEVFRSAVGCGNNNNNESSNSGGKCDKLCSSFLSPELCKEKCARLRDPGILKCFKSCDFHYPKANSEDCSKCKSKRSWNINFGEKRSNNNTPFLIQSKNSSGTMTSSPALKKRCHNIGLFSSNMGLFSNKPIHNVNMDEDEPLLWMNQHWTPLECQESSNMTCRAQVLQNRTEEEIEKQCTSNPFRLIDMLTCVITIRLFSLKMDTILEFLPEFHKENCLDENLRSQLILEWEFKETSLLCGGGEGPGECYLPIHKKPSNIINLKCRVAYCQKTGRSRHCPPVPDGHVVELDQFSTCRWKVDLSKAQDPYALWGTYFNELTPFEISDKLKQPDTTYILPETVYNNKISHYTFPYFVVVRGICDTGGHYGSGSYKALMSGETPKVKLRYRPFTPRDRPTGYAVGSFNSALIKLRRREDDDLIPENPLSINGSSELGCHEGICYPGFAVPLMYLQLPTFGVKVQAQEQFDDHSIQIYVSAFHSRSTEGIGEIQIAEGDFPGHPALLFPKFRSSFATDSELNENADCILLATVTPPLENVNSSTDETPRRTCPEIEHLTDDWGNPYLRNIFEPLDAEDILRAQYTFGTSPIKAIAGFYDPRMMVLGDPDMEHFEVVNWGNVLKGLKGDQQFHSCVQHHHVHRGNQKPIYSWMDRSDPAFPIKFYRQRYAPLKFRTDPDAIKSTKSKSTESTTEYGEGETAIFEAIGLVDRVLLVTPKGLVPFYGHMNSTVTEDIAWEYFPEEVVNRCFKIVRILPRAQTRADTIVGITYDYIVKNTLGVGVKQQEISQEIWIGRLTNPAEPIAWKKFAGPRKQHPKGRSLQEDFPLSAGSQVIIIFAVKGDVSVLPIHGFEKPGVPIDYSKTHPKSEIENVCFKAFTSQISKFSKNMRLYPSRGWCEALDATPVHVEVQFIQVLVRLRAYYDPAGNPENLYFYILADFRLPEKITSDDEDKWNIVAIIPRFPCIDEHSESIKNVLVYDREFFKRNLQAQGSATECAGRGRSYRGCHDTYRFRVDYHIFLHGMSYPRTFTNHLFLYGSRLLHSTNNGKSFVFLKSFPQKFENIDRFTSKQDCNQSDPYKQPRTNHLHRIVQMAFDNTGHYAFLTNKLELWIGSTGATDQIRLRPSPLQSMVQMGISRQKNIMDGVPFAIDFDVNNKLYEMVAVLDEQGLASRVLKRPVDMWSLLRVQTLLGKLHEYSTTTLGMRHASQKLSKELQIPFRYKTTQWSTFCPYSSPVLTQNFSKTQARSQVLKFLHPEQHLFVGNTHTEASLLAFQAITFHVTLKTLFDPPVRLYSGVDKHPFEVWAFRRRFETAIGELRFKLALPNEKYGIIFQPYLYERLELSQTQTTLLGSYNLDYGLTAEIRLEFSVKNDYAVTNIDFEADQTNLVQLNIENANGTLIQLNTEKEVFADRAAVLFIIRMHVNKKAGLSQRFPGQEFIPVPVIYHLIGAFGNCIDYKHDGIIGDRLQTVAVIGCPTGKDFVFDWNRTLNSIYLRGDKVPDQERVKHGRGDLCYKGTFACFFSRKPMILHFQVFDEAQQTFTPYTGKYIMRVVGGGRSWDNLDVYSREQVEAFNMPGVSDVSLVWSEWDPINHQKITRKIQNPGEDYDVDFDPREAVLQAGQTSITWSCHTLSPCARIAPNSDFEVVYWFRVFISNRYVEKDTLCLFEKEFDIMLYGFHPSPEAQLLTTLGFAFLMLGILYILFLCCRRQKKLWEHTKRNTKTWLHIIRDAIPKKIRIHEPPLGEDAPPKESMKKFRMPGSPDMSRESFTSLEHDDHSLSIGMSSTSVVASSSTNSHIGHSFQGVAAQVKSKTDMIYDQLLQKKLNSIVERNRTLRKNLLKKASIHSLSEDQGVESRFEKKYGRTVSQESLFTPPMPKAKKGIMDTLF